MHPLPHSVCDAGVHQLKGIARGSTNLSWGIAFKKLQSDSLAISLKLAGKHKCWKVCSLVSDHYTSNTRKLGGRPDVHLGSMQVIGCC